MTGGGIFSYSSGCKSALPCSPNELISMSAILSYFSKKMTSYNIYPDLKECSAPPQPTGLLQAPQSYHLNVIQSKQQGLLRLEERYAKKCSKYSKILSRFVWLNACSSGLSVATGISNVVTLSTFSGLLMSIPLDVVYLAGASVSGVATVLTSKY